VQEPSAISKIAFLGDYLPRKCGIATFTTDLCCAIAAEFPALQCLVVPVNDLAGGYGYPAEVRFEIAEQDLPSYLRAADFLNITDVDVVCVEHEFGIFGGPAGSHVLALLRELRMPIVTTLHTILREPNDDQRRVIIRRFVGQKSLREIATEFGRSEGAIKQLQLRALQNLRERIRSNHGTHSNDSQCGGRRKRQLDRRRVCDWLCGRFSGARRSGKYASHAELRQRHHDPGAPRT